MAVNINAIITAIITIIIIIIIINFIDTIVLFMYCFAAVILYSLMSLCDALVIVYIRHLTRWHNLLVFSIYTHIHYLIILFFFWY